MEEAQEPGPEPEAEGGRVLRLVLERGVDQPELLERVPEVLDAAVAGREHAAEDHRLGFLESGEGMGRRLRLEGDGLADPGVAELLDPGDEVADLPRRDLVRLDRLRGQVTDLLDLVLGVLDHEEDLVARLELAVEDPDEDDDAAVDVEPGVEEERLERGVRVALGRRDAVDDRLEDGIDARPPLGADHQGVLAVEADDVLHLVERLLDVRLGEVDLVDDRDEDEVVLDGEVGVGQGLGLDALGGVDDQDGPVAGREAPRDLVGEVHVAGRIDEVQDVILAVLRPDRGAGPSGP